MFAGCCISQTWKVRIIIIWHSVYRIVVFHIQCILLIGVSNKYSTWNMKRTRCTWPIHFVVCTVVPLIIQPLFQKKKGGYTCGYTVCSWANPAPSCIPTSEMCFAHQYEAGRVFLVPFHLHTAEEKHPNQGKWIMSGAAVNVRIISQLFLDVTGCDLCTKYQINVFEIRWPLYLGKKQMHGDLTNETFF